MPLIVAISSVTPCGIASTARRSSARLNETPRRVAEIPTIVVMTLTSTSSPEPTPSIADLLVDRPPTSGRCDERVGRRGAARAGLVDFRRVAHMQQGLDDAPG